jgi:KUP system potassium uptake protein
LAGHLHPDADLERRSRLLNEKLRADAIDLPSFPGSGFCQPARPGGGHSRVPHRRGGHRAQRPAAQPQAQQGAARNNLFVTVRNHEVPWIGIEQAPGDRLLGHDCWQVVIHYGFKNDPDVPKALEQINPTGL